VSYPSNAASPHAISATYLGDATFGASSSASFNENVMQTTTTTLGSSLNPTTMGTPVTFTATVAKTGGIGTPTGNVAFRDGGTPVAGCGGVGGVALIAGSPDTATCTVTYATTAGSPDAITAIYLGDGSFVTSTASALNETVTKAASSFTASATPASVAHGSSSSLAETGLPGGATGKVTFASGGTLCTATLPAASCATSTMLPAGSYPITATYSGDANYAGSTVSTYLTVAMFTTSFTASATPSTTVYGNGSALGEIGLPGGATGTVTFTSGAALCMATLPATSCTTSSVLSVGRYPVTATYSGDANYAESTATTSLTVTPATTTTIVTSSLNPAVPGQRVMYTATVGPDPGGGTVTLTDNGVPILGCIAVPVDPSTGRAACSTTYPSSGQHVIVADYTGDANFSGSSAPSSGVIALSESVIDAVPVPDAGAVRAGDVGARIEGALLVVVGSLIILIAYVPRWRRRAEQRIR